MLALFSNAYVYLLFSKLCQHNLPTPILHMHTLNGIDVLHMHGVGPKQRHNLRVWVGQLHNRSGYKSGLGTGS